jgi:hypothetical protein
MYKKQRQYDQVWTMLKFLKFIQLI